MPEKVREEFEAWCESELNLRTVRLTTGDYQSFGADMAWRAWQASRDTLVIDLPALNPEMFSCNVVFGHEKARTEAERAITAAGLKVKAAA